MVQGSAPETLDIDKTRAGTDIYFQENIYERLLGRDITGAVVPKLATSYEISPDGLQYTFHLRHGVKFHNGEPFNANAAKFSFERFVNPATENLFSFQLASLKTADVIDPYTLRLTLSAPNGALVDNLGFAGMVPPSYITAHGDAYFGQHPVGTGPFKFKSYVQGQSWSMERFDQYWGPKASYASVNTTIISADSSRLAALESGEADFITQVNPTDAKSLASRGFKVLSTYSGTAFGLEFNMNIAGAPWQKLAVRQALNYGINRASIRDALFLGYSIDLAKGLNRYEPGYSLLSYEDPAYDPKKARQLLKSAGHPNGFSIDLVGPANGRFVNSAQVMEAVAGQWADIGVKANVQALAYTPWINNIVKTGDFNGIAFIDESGLDPTAFYTTYFGSGAYSHVLHDSHLNSLLPAMFTASGAARAQACAAVATYNNEQCFMLPLYGDKVLYGMNKNVDWTPWVGDSGAYMSNAKPA
jgi:peptide/nickel transport system substrate-binding protein